MSGPSPRISEREAAEIARTHYGLEARVERLAGEKDDNFRLDAGDQSYVLKVAHIAEGAEVLELTGEVLDYVRRVAPSLPVATPIAAEDGRFIARFESEGGDERMALLTTFLGGRALRHTPTSAELRANLGRTLAQLVRALEHFEHSGLDRYVMWDLQRADGVMSWLAELESSAHGTAGRYAAAAACLERFNELVASRLEGLRRQAVHNDFSADNLLVADNDLDIAGVLDFGDMTNAPLICDLGIAATSQVQDSDRPMAPVLDVVRGYHEVLPLREEELELLCDLVRTRLATRIVISEWRAAKFPQNKTYVLRNTALAHAQLGRLPVEAIEQVSAELIAACHDGSAS